MSNKIQEEKNTLFIKKTAEELGFSQCGISKADFLEEEAPKLENWLFQNKNAGMGWMENHFDKRLDPRKLVPDSKSVVSLLFNYYPQEHILHDEQDFKISKYAYGRDYHKVIKKKLKQFMLAIQEEVGEVNGRAFVDSAPVMDKAWAKRSGLGWQGKNGNLIVHKEGSFFFISELIIDLPLEYDNPIRDFCGNCRLCIDACPTDALSEAYVVDANRCISYLTIELKDAMPTSLKNKMDNWIFGCDVCQDVCPWNKRSKPHNQNDFNPKEELKNMDVQKWKEITEEVFDNLFIGSAVKRTGFNGLKRNISFLE